MKIESLQMPKKIERDESSYSQTFGRFTLTPLERGFGNTIGNALRRVLMSSIQGAAIRFVRIEGLPHQFMAIPYAKEDYVELVLNLKQVIVKMDTMEEQKFVLEKKGPGIVTAGDITVTGNAKIINPDLELLTLVDDVDFRMELWAGVGRGFVSEKEQSMVDKPVGTIPIDSIYAPITNVNYYVENERTGRRVDFDKLIIEVKTNGSIDPEVAVSLAGKILKDHFDLCINLEQEPQFEEEEEFDQEFEKMRRLLKMSVNELELSVRSNNCLAAARIETIGEMVKKSETEMLKYRNFGKRSLDEINKVLAQYNLQLGMDVARYLDKK